MYILWINNADFKIYIISDTFNGILMNVLGFKKKKQPNI